MAWDASSQLNQCRFCRSLDVKHLDGEINIHLTGSTYETTSSVLLFESVLLCLNCGAAVFSIPEGELDVITAAEQGQD